MVSENRFSGKTYFIQLPPGILVDGVRMVCGYALMFAYTMFMLGKWNMVEHRSYLAMMGILAVGFGLIISLGITMFFGFPYTPIHGILPFLALGWWHCTVWVGWMSRRKWKNGPHLPVQPVHPIVQGCDQYKYFGSPNQIPNQIRLVL